MPTSKKYTDIEDMGVYDRLGMMLYLFHCKSESIFASCDGIICGKGKVNNGDIHVRWNRIRVRAHMLQPDTFPGWSLPEWCALL